MIPNLKDSAMQDMLMLASTDLKFFCKWMFPERFEEEFCSLHDQIFDAIKYGGPRVAIAAPRGIGKTSIVGLGLAAHKILFDESRYLTYVSNTHESACEQTENLKRELMSNRMIPKIWGEMKVKNPVLDESFSKKAWIAKGRTFISPRGSGQQIRGKLYRDYRPDLFIIDDLEDPKTIMNEEIRRLRKIWFYADVMKATSRFKNDWQIVYIDTLKHEDSLLQFLMDSAQWESVRLELCDDNHKTHVPEFYSQEQLDKDIADHEADGLMDVFYREYRNLPISTSDASFQKDNFRRFSDAGDYLLLEQETVDQKQHWIKRKQQAHKPQNQTPFHDLLAGPLTSDEICGRVRKHDLITAVLADPARTIKVQSADTAVVGIGVDRTSQRIFVLDVIAGKFYPEEIYDHMFNMVEKLQAGVFGVETTGLGEFIEQPIRNEMRVRNVSARFEQLASRGSKEERIAKLVPYYRRGYIYHNAECCEKLEKQLLGFPRSKLWDVMDILAYTIPLMDALHWMFDPPEDYDSKHDEYADLRDEPDYEHMYQPRSYI